jgi:hypothetical protein
VKPLTSTLLILSSLALPAVALAEDTEAEAPPAADQTADLEAKVTELEAQLQAMSDRLDEGELQALIDKANVAALSPAEEEPPENRVFVAAGRAMQRTNPEISVSGDLLWELPIDDGLRDGTPYGLGMPVRAFGVHMQSVLDPYSIAKIAFELFPDPEAPVNLEEVYITWFGVIPSLSFTLGRFRPDFGAVQRGHEHDLDQTNYPEAMFLMGYGGLTGHGFTGKWMMPRLWAHANELTFAVFDGDNPYLFSQEPFHSPAGMLKLKNYWDLSESTYLELGFSGVAGQNNPSAASGEPDAEWGTTIVGGADLKLYWSPPKQARYRSLTWQSELFLVEKQLPGVADWNQGIGAYSYLQYQLGASWYVGLRGDWVRPIASDGWENYDGVFQGSFERDDLWRAVPYATFWQSEFVYLRGEYWYTLGLDDQIEHRVLLQVDFAAGPHKHEKY